MQTEGAKQKITEVSPSTPSTPSECIAFLKSNSFDTTKQFYEFVIDVKEHPFTIENLQQIILLPYEVALTEKNGQIILGTGGEHDPNGDDQTTERSYHSRLSFHSHSKIKNPLATVPSLSDVYDVDRVDKNTPLVLAHAQGLMIYGMPSYDPLLKKPIRKSGDPLGLMARYLAAKGVSQWASKYAGNHRSYFDLTTHEQSVLTNDFARETKMIIDEAPWSDTKGCLRILDVINLKPYRKPL